ncbi:MAG: EamA family transporter, partial [Calditrichia bacterium]
MSQPMRFIAFLFLCLIWGTTWIAIKFSLGGFPPFLGAAARFSVAVLFLFAFLKMREVSLRIPLKTALLITLTAFLMYVMDYGLIYWGEQFLNAGITAIFFATFPLFTSIYSVWLFRSESFRLHKLIGLLLGFAGIILVFYDQLAITRFDHVIILAALAVIAGAAGGSLAVVLVKKYLSGINSTSMAFHQMLQGIFFLLLFSFFLENWRDIHPTLPAISAVFYLGILGSAVAFAIYYWLLTSLSAV